MSQSQVIAVEELQRLHDLHLTTCTLMTSFINGHHCPKLAHLIVHQLGQLLSFSRSLQITTNQEMYVQLLEHWQNVTQQLLEQQFAKQKIAVQYH